MKTRIGIYRLRVQDFNVQTGETFTNKGIFTNNQFEALSNKISHLKIFYDYREIKNGWIFYDFNPVNFMKIFK